MATSVFFNNFGASGEQQLLDSLIVESIKVYGSDMYYIPRELANFDKIYGSDDSSRYDDAILIEMYIRNNQGWLGNKDMIKQIAGLDIDDEVKFTIAKTTFDQLIGTTRGFARPREGDLIFFPLNNRAFQISFVDKFEIFYQLGSLYTWEVTAVLFEYSQEKFDTGIADIDSIVGAATLDIYDYSVRTEAGQVIMTEGGEVWTLNDHIIAGIDPLGDNDELNTRINTIEDWSQEDPMAEYGKLG